MGLQNLDLKIVISVCNVDDVISSIKASTQTQENKIDALDNLKKDVNEFVADVVRIDGDVADAINKSKNDFYDKYEYLKPDIEKSWLEESTRPIIPHSLKPNTPESKTRGYISR